MDALKTDGAAGESLAAWQIVLRHGMFPQWTDVDLANLLSAVESNDPRLIQGHQSDPLPMTANLPKPVCGACMVSYVGWMRFDDRSAATVGDLDTFTFQAFMRSEILLGELSIKVDGRLPGWMPFLEWFDDLPREEVFRQLSQEIRVEQARRKLIRDNVQRAL